jgi:hypothetical protein
MCGGTCPCCVWQTIAMRITRLKIASHQVILKAEYTKTERQTHLMHVGRSLQRCVAIDSRPCLYVMSVHIRVHCILRLLHVRVGVVTTPAASPTAVTTPPIGGRHPRAITVCCVLRSTPLAALLAPRLGLSFLLVIRILNLLRITATHSYQVSNTKTQFIS